MLIEQCYNSRASFSNKEEASKAPHGAVCGIAKDGLVFGQTILLVVKYH
jgi:hypothetical protein